MAGNKSGGLKTAASNKAKYGQDYYALIGSKGGKSDKGGRANRGFAASHERAVSAGRKGGLLSRRNSRLSNAERKKVLSALSDELAPPPRPKDTPPTVIR